MPTKLISKNRLTKKFIIHEDGKIEKEQAAPLARAEAVEFDCAFPDLLKNLDDFKSTEALVLGSCTESLPKTLVKKSTSFLFPDAITRTKKFFDWNENSNLLLFDADSTDLTPEEGIELLYSLFHQKFAALIRPSSSAYVPKDRFNYHIFAEVEGDMRFFKDYFKALMINEGFFKLDITKVGSVLTRTVFDTAVISPERIVYVAKPLIQGDLNYKPFKAFYKHIDVGPLKFTTQNLPYVLAQANQKISEAKYEIRTSVKEVRQKYIEKEAPKLRKQFNISHMRAVQIINNRFNGYLTENDTVYTPEPDSKPIALSSVVRGSHIEEVLKDPLEPDYHGGAGVAMILSRFVIHSFAHGGRLIHILINPNTYEDLLHNTQDEEELAELIEHININKLNINKFVDITKKELGITKKEAIEHLRNFSPLYRKNIKGEVVDKEFELPQLIELSQDPTHYDIAMAFVKQIAPKHSVIANGFFYEYNPKTGIWDSFDLNVVKDRLLMTFDGKRLFSRNSDYNAVIRVLLDIKSQNDFFEDATPGINTENCFIEVDPEGNIHIREHRPDYKARYLFQGEYTKQYPKRFLKFLHEQIGAEQTQLLQRVFGAILFQKLYLFQQVLFLYGVAQSGKSTILEVINKLIPEGTMCSVSPFEFNNDNKRYLMINALINAVPELPRNRKIPAEIFKTVIAGEPITIKKLYNDTVSARILCSHIFSGNFLIKTDDISLAFKRRFIIIKFDKTIPMDSRILGFSDLLVNEERNEILSWGIRGYADILRNNIKTLNYTNVQKTIEMEMDLLNNSTLSFINDPDYVESGSRFKVARKGLYLAYKNYCNEMGLQEVSKLEFLQELQEYFPEQEIKNGITYIKGLRLVEI